MSSMRRFLVGAVQQGAQSFDSAVCLLPFGCHYNLVAEFGAERHHVQDAFRIETDAVLHEIDLARISFGRLSDDTGWPCMDARGILDDKSSIQSIKPPTSSI